MVCARRLHAERNLRTPFRKQTDDRGDYGQIFEKGIYSPGSKLPSEKELMEQYNVSRITSKKALEMLADRNIIVRMPGKGSFVLEENEQDRENLPAVSQTVEPVRKGENAGCYSGFFQWFLRV